VDHDVSIIRVVGVSFFQADVAGCSPGEVVTLCHEPDNPHDELAIRVETATGKTVGYIPRDSWIRHAIHEQGRGASAVVASVGYSRACLIGMNISVAVCDDMVPVRSYYPDRLPPEAPPGGFRYWVKSPSASARRAKASTG
jgi:hypothetical protein